MPRHLLAALIAAVLAILPAAAVGDVLTATRSQPLVEASHRVDVTVKDGIATYIVQRAFHNPGKVAEEARLDIRLPYGAVATGLRIKAGSRWYDGELMHRDKAEELYRELTGQGPSEPKDPALLYWQWTDRLGLRVFPILPGRTGLVEYTLTAPTSYRDGTHFISYGRRPDAKNLTTPIVHVRGIGIKAVVLDGQRQSGRSLSLDTVKPHPILARHAIERTQVLVRPLSVRDAVLTKGVRLTVDIQHTWSGDLDVALIDPGGKLHLALGYDFARSDNDLKRAFDVAYDGDMLGDWYLLITDHHPLDGGTLRAWSIEPSPVAGAKAQHASHRFTDSTPAFIPQPADGEADVANIGLELATATHTHVRLGRVAMVSGKEFTNIEIDMAKELSQLPACLSVVFVIDASHSMGEDGIATQLRLAQAYVSHVPTARVALVGFGREAERWSGFVDAKQLEVTVATLHKTKRLLPRNGSFLDAGLDEAATLVASVKGPSAVVAMTDDRLRPHWTNQASLATIGKLPKETIVHVAEIKTWGEPNVTRDDTHRLFPLAALRGGVAVQNTGAEDGKWTQLRSQVRYLVRPDRLDNPHLSAMMPSALEDVLQDSGDGSIHEGAAIRWMAQVESAPTTVTLSGELWSRKVSFVSTSAEPFHRATAGYVFSLDHYHQLSESEQFVIAMYGGAVSPVTSYLAIEPGVRPSTIGLEDTAFGTGMGDTFGSGASGDGKYDTMDWSALIAAARKACEARRKGNERATVTVDVNDHEIADVHPPALVSAFGQCVVDAIWRYQVPGRPFGDVTKRLTI